MTSTRVGPVRLPACMECPCCAAPIATVPCPRCGTDYVVIDGICCFADPLELAREQGAMLAPDWLAGDAEALCAGASALDPLGALFRERALAGVFAAAHYPESCPLADSLACNARSVARLGAWLDRHPAPRDAGSPAALEAGCGPGRFLFELAPRFPGGAIGFDLRVGLLRIATRMIDCGEVALPWRASGRRFQHLLLLAPRRPPAPITLVQGNLFHAPFARGAFPLVAAVSLLDILPDPAAGLERLDALVAPGGLLLLACPYQWEAPSVPPSAWWPDPERFLRAWLGGRGYEIVEEDMDLPWAVPSHARLVHRYSLHAVLARKSHGR